MANMAPKIPIESAIVPNVDAGSSMNGMFSGVLRFR